jgi:hypothetical protein
VSQEVEIALNQEIKDGVTRVLPLVVDDCNVPAFLIGNVHADFREPLLYRRELLWRRRRRAIDPKIKVDRNCRARPA